MARSAGVTLTDAPVDECVQRVLGIINRSLGDLINDGVFYDAKKAAQNELRGTNCWPAVVARLDDLHRELKDLALVAA